VRRGHEFGGTMTRSRSVIAGAVIAALAVVGIATTSAGAQTTTVQVNDDGVGSPPPGSGLGTKAALENPKCNADAVDGWGVFPMVTETDGPFCVAPAPTSNGGATARGVTADTIKVVVVVPNAEQISKLKTQNAQLPKNVATGAQGTYEAAVNDEWAVFAHVYETWGRTVEFTYVTSSGSDEASQRADAVVVKQTKPMFVLDTIPSGLSTMATVLAADKYVVFDYGTTNDDALAQPGYRWGTTSQYGTSINMAQFVGRQLAKGNAEFAGDAAMKAQKRKFGMIAPADVDSDAFVAALKKLGVTLATPPLEYTANGSPTGDPVTAQQEAPALISKLKDAGVTSVIVFTDIGMTDALTKVATQQQFSPEWLMTGYQYQDITLLARNYDQEQWSHAFGISNLIPNVEGALSMLTQEQWYWGKTTSTTDIVTQNTMLWMASAIQYAGPKLTVKNVQRGLFAVPARYGAAAGDPLGLQIAWGKTSGLPSPSYFTRGTDFAAVWYDAKTVGPSQVYPTAGQGVTWYLNDGKRYTASTWPKEPLDFFKPTGAVVAFDTAPIPRGAFVPCTDCPSTGGAGTPSEA
jgi:hypothetical protein